MHLSNWLPYVLSILVTGGIFLPAERAGAIDAARMWATYSTYPANRPEQFHDWQQAIQKNQSSLISDQLRQVNEFFNRRIRFGEDQQIWGQSDYWATPMETLAKGAGDCEDFAIAKYFSLLASGVPVEQLRLVYVKARIGGPSSSIQQAHMVLAFYSSPEAEPLVLDNLITEIRPASRRPDLQAVFSFNSQGIFAGTAGNAALGPSGVAGLSHWQDLLRRARNEGFD